MKRLKSLVLGLAFLATSALSAGAAVVHPADTTGLTVTPGGYIDSVSALKTDLADLGDGTVLAALKSLPWFNTSGITQLASSIGSGNCDGLVTCFSSPKKGATYSGTSSVLDDANLFVVHVGGPGGGTLLAFLYSSLLNDFSISGFRNGVSWIRAYTVPGVIKVDPVPLPGGIVLLLSGLAGLAGLGRMRKAAAKA